MESSLLSEVMAYFPEVYEKKVLGKWLLMFDKYIKSNSYKKLFESQIEKGSAEEVSVNGIVIIAEKKTG